VLTDYEIRQKTVPVMKMLKQRMEWERHYYAVSSHRWWNENV